MRPHPSTGDHAGWASRSRVVQAFQETMHQFLGAQHTVIDRVLSSARAGSASARWESPITPPPEVSTPLGRYVLRGEPVPLADLPESLRLAGLHLVVGEPASVRDAVVAGIRSRGAHAEPVSAASLGDASAWAMELTKLRNLHGPVRGLVHLSGLATEPMPTTLADWQDVNRATAKTLYNLLQVNATDLGGGGRCIALSSLDGAFGRQSGVWQGPAGSAATSGLLKTAALEWPRIGVKAIDVDVVDPQFIRSVVVAELLSADPAQEIGYRAGTRLVFEAILEPLSGNSSAEGQAPGTVPSADWVVLATGGARGITAETVAELLVPGLTLVLVGRAEEPAEESLLTRSLTGVAALRGAFLKQAMATGQKFTPAQIERQISELQRDRAIRASLDAFRQRGVRVEYHAVDVRDAAAFGGIIDALYARFGRIDAVIHGAGVIEDKLLVDKTPDSYDRVFDTKANSTYVLAQKLRPETLHWLVLFASVAGRTGNRGQSDYAVANELVNRFAWWLHYCWPSVTVKAFNWGPWESGMASDEVNRQFRERGIIPIPPREGREFMLREMRDGPGDDVEVIAGTFDFGLAHPATAPGFPLLQSAVQAISERSVTVERVFSLERDAQLLQHSPGGPPAVPGAVALEWMSEVVQAGWPHLQIAEVLAHQFWRGIPLDKPVSMRAWADVPKNLSTLTVTAEFVDADHPATSYGRTQFLLRHQLPACPPASLIPADNLAGEPQDGDCLGASRRFLLRKAAGYEAGSVVTITLGQSEIGGGWLFDPALVDAAIQAQSLWGRRHLGMSSSPSYLTKLERFRGPDDRAIPLHLHLTVHRVDATTIRSDWHWADAAGFIRLKAEGMMASLTQA